MMARTILVVEDEIVVAMEIEEKLKLMGYDVTAICSTGEDAVSELGQQVPDLVLMDIKLDGEIDGIQTAEMIHRDHDIPVVYLTAYADDVTLNRAKVTEPFGYLVKPFSETELRTTIEVALYKHQQDKRTKESARWFASTIDVLGAALLVTDEDGAIKHINSVGAMLTGWNQEDAVGMYFGDVYVLRDPETGELMSNPASEPMKVGFTSGLSRSILVSKDDTEIEIENSLLPITDAEGNFTGIIIAFQEVMPQEVLRQDWFNHAANLYLAATLCSSDGEYAKAESFYKRTLLLFERHLGSSHPKVGNVLRDLAELYKKTGRPAEAEKLEERAGIRRRTESESPPDFGSDHA